MSFVEFPLAGPRLLGFAFFGLRGADIAVLLGYFVAILAIGFWAMWRVRSQEDYFLGGRRFGKWIQVFASFGQATSSDSAVNSTTMVSTNGAAGVWANMSGGLLNLPLIWFWSMWFRRVRLTTLADIYEQRYDSRRMAGFYALMQCLFLVIGGGMGLVALSKTVAAIAVKPESALTVEERAELAQATELRKLESADYAGLAAEQRVRLADLRTLGPRTEFSYVNQTLFKIVIALVVFVYAGIGGLEGAFITDLVQGCFLLVLSFMLLPFAMVRINHNFGTSGLLGPFHALHLQLPESFFELWGSWAVPEFTWYWIVAFSALSMVHTAVQANGMVGPASAKDDFTARYGFVVGILMKRYSTVLWGLLAMFCLLLYGTTVKDADYVWGLATRDLLGSAGFGLVGLMVACLLAAMMSTMSAHQMVVAALVTRNVYLPGVREWRRSNRPELAPRVDENAGLSEKHLIWMGRIFGGLYVLGAVAIATTFTSVFGLFKFLTMFNCVVAASFWLGMLWRRANRLGAWTSMVVTFFLMLLLPFVLPAIPGVRTSAYLLRQTDQPPVSRTYVAKEGDVVQRADAIRDWDAKNADPVAIGERPAPLTVGQHFEKSFKFPPRSVFWGDDIAIVNGRPQGRGWLKVELVVLDKLGWDLSKNSYSLNETLSMLLRLVVPFGTLILVSLVTAPEDRRRLDRFFVRLKTRVDPDPAIDAREMELSYADPSRFDHRKLFPASNWEFRKWDRDDLGGVIGTTLAAAGCVFLLWLMVTIGG